jgi:hypothetical protein
MPNYSNSVIYSVRLNDNNKLIYIGSTTQNIAVRFGGHKRDFKCSLYKFIEKTYNGVWSNCYIELYERFPCNNKEDLNKREGEIMRQIKQDDKYILINKCIAGRTLKEYYNENIDKVLENKKQYRKNNADKIKEYNKQYRTKKLNEIKNDFDN